MADIIKNKYFTQIKAPDLSSTEYGANIQQVFENINQNFQKVITLPFIKGDDGKSIDMEIKPLWDLTNVEVKPDELFNNYNKCTLTKVGAMLYNKIFEKDQFNWDEQTTYEEFKLDLKKYSTDDNIWDQSVGPNSKHNPSISLYYKIIEGGDKIYLGASQLFYFLDPRLRLITSGIFNKEEMPDFTDLSCLLLTNNTIEYLEDITNNYPFEFVKMEGWPTIYYENNQFNWKINGVKTGINAQGVKGVDGDGSRIWIARGNTYNPYESNILETNALHPKTYKYAINEIYDPESKTWVKLKALTINRKPKNQDLVIYYLATEASSETTTELIPKPVVLTGLFNEDASGDGSGYVVADITNTITYIDHEIKLRNALNAIGNNDEGENKTSTVQGLFVPTYQQNVVHSMYTDYISTTDTSDTDIPLYLSPLDEKLMNSSKHTIKEEVGKNDKNYDRFKNLYIDYNTHIGRTGDDKWTGKNLSIHGTTTSDGHLEINNGGITSTGEIHFKKTNTTSSSIDKLDFSGGNFDLTSSSTINLQNNNNKISLNTTGINLTSSNININKNNSTITLAPGVTIARDQNGGVDIDVFGNIIISDSQSQSWSIVDKEVNSSRNLFTVYHSSGDIAVGKGKLYPAGNGTQDLGTVNNKWNNIYGNYIDINKINLPFVSGNSLITDALKNTAFIQAKYKSDKSGNITDGFLVNFSLNVIDKNKKETQWGSQFLIDDGMSNQIFQRSKYSDNGEIKYTKWYKLVSTGTDKTNIKNSIFYGNLDIRGVDGTTSTPTITFNRRGLSKDPTVTNWTIQNNTGNLIFQSEHDAKISNIIKFLQDGGIKIQQNSRISQEGGDLYIGRTYTTDSKGNKYIPGWVRMSDMCGLSYSNNNSWKIYDNGSAFFKGKITIADEICRYDDLYHMSAGEIPYVSKGISPEVRANRFAFLNTNNIILFSSSNAAIKTTSGGWVKNKNADWVDYFKDSGLNDDEQTARKLSLFSNTDSYIIPIGLSGIENRTLGEGTQIIIKYTVDGSDYTELYHDLESIVMKFNYNGNSCLLDIDVCKKYTDEINDADKNCKQKILDLKKQLQIDLMHARNPKDKQNLIEQCAKDIKAAEQNRINIYNNAEWESLKIGTMPRGWAGMNMYNFNRLNCGGSKSQFNGEGNAHCYMLRFYFYYTEIGTHGKSYIYTIEGHGDMMHRGGSNFARLDHLYDWDIYQNMNLPNGLTSNGNIIIKTPNVNAIHGIYFDNYRCADDGGGWDNTLFTVRNKAFNSIFECGIFGFNNDLHYMYIGGNKYNSKENFRIYPNGDIKAKSLYLNHNQVISYTSITNSGHSILNLGSSGEGDGKYAIGTSYLELFKIVPDPY